MGCFNVACSVSKISIRSQDPVVFVLLLPSNYSIRKYPQIKSKFNTLEPAKMLIHSNEYFEAFALPIHGEYNDYGGLDDIKKTPNVIALEKYFGFPIKDLISVIGDNRGYASNLFELQKIFIKNHKIVNDNKPIDSTFLKALGFIESNEEFTHEKFKVKVVLKPSKFHRRNFSILDENNKELIDHSVYDYNEKHYFMENIASLTGYYLGVADDQKEKLNLVLNLSGMFIHSDIYSDLSKGDSFEDRIRELRINENYLKKLGFKKKKISANQVLYSYKKLNILITDDWTLSLCNKELKPIKSEHYLGSLYSLKEIALEQSVELAFNKLKAESLFSGAFESLKEKVILINKQKTVKDSDLQTILKKMKFFLRIDESDTNAFSFLKSNESHEIYSESIADGSIKNEALAWAEASNLMYSMNCHFFPAMNGEQHGNDKLTKRLLEKSLEIVNKNLKKYDE